MFSEGISIGIYFYMGYFVFHSKYSCRPDNTDSDKPTRLLSCLGRVLQTTGILLSVWCPAGSTRTTAARCTWTAPPATTARRSTAGTTATTSTTEVTQETKVHSYLLSRDLSFIRLMFHLLMTFVQYSL